MKEKYGFVYIWYDRKHKRYYIGAHWGTEDDGYICSSKWMLNAYKCRPQDFHKANGKANRRILERVYTNKKDTYIIEGYWLRLIKKDELKNKYYNIRNVPSTYWHVDNEKPDIIKILREKSHKLNERKEACKYCGFIGNLGTIGRYHNERCKTIGYINPPTRGRGSKLSEERKLKVSEIHKGRIWYTNGIENIKVFPGDELEGFYLGMTYIKDRKKRKFVTGNSKNSRWFTNGINNKRIFDVLPEGFYLGKTHHG